MTNILLKSGEIKFFGLFFLASTWRFVEPGSKVDYHEK